MEELRAGNPLILADATLVPIECYWIQADSGNMGCWLTGVKEILAVVVCDAAGIRAFGIDSAEVAVDGLIQKTPNLFDILNEIKVGSPDEWHRE
jgi:hypothetical protein